MSQNGILLGPGPLVKVVANLYSPSSTYAVGDYCIHDGRIYKCKTAISLGETWDSTKWNKVVLTEEIEANKQDIDKLSEDTAIIIDGNKSVDGAAEGQYVLLRNSTISGKTDGSYTAAKAIPANTTIDSSYLSLPISGGISNGLESEISSLNANSVTKQTISTPVVKDSPVTINLESSMVYFLTTSGSGAGRNALLLVNTTSVGTPLITEIYKGDSLTFTTGTNAITISSVSTYGAWANLIKIGPSSTSS